MLDLSVILKNQRCHSRAGWNPGNWHTRTKYNNYGFPIEKLGTDNISANKHSNYITAIAFAGAVLCFKNICFISGLTL